MKKLLLLAVVGGAAVLGSCSTKCPAYSSVKPATQVSSSIEANTSATATASAR